MSGVGLGIASVAANGMATDVAPDLRGAASGLVNTAAQLGTALGTAALHPGGLGHRPANRLGGGRGDGAGGGASSFVGAASRSGDRGHPA